VLRANLIWIRIRILDPHWKKKDPDKDLDHEHLFTDFWTEEEFSYNFFLFFLLILMQQLSEKHISFFSTVQFWVLGVKFFFAVFGWYYAQAKMLQILRIRILSTVYYHLFYSENYNIVVFLQVMFPQVSSEKSSFFR